MYTIQSIPDLLQLISDLRLQGFPIDSDVVTKAIKERVKSIVHKANTLLFTEDTDKLVKDTLLNYNEFPEIERVITGYFARKTPEDRIRQIVSQLILRATDTISLPYASDKPKIWEAYRATLAKYNLSEQEQATDHRHQSIYDLRKKTLRISRLKDYRPTFAQLINLLTGEQAVTLGYDSPVGEWLSVSKSIEVKFYRDDSGEIRGTSVAQLKQYYTEYLANKPSAIVIT